MFCVLLLPFNTIYLLIDKHLTFTSPKITASSTPTISSFVSPKASKTKHSKQQQQNFNEIQLIRSKGTSKPTTTGRKKSLQSISSLNSANVFPGSIAAAVAAAAAEREAASSENSQQFCTLVVRDPVLIRGAGNITIFGICNKFNETFPAALNSKLAPEEFKDTMHQVNSILSAELENSLKWLIFGSLFCCCTLGCSFLPVVCLNKRAKSHIEKFLEVENHRLYLRLGLRCSLSKMKCSNSNSLMEYVLLIDFLPNALLYQPD